MPVAKFFDRTKEGPGVKRDEPKRSPLTTFFVIFGRKFWEIIRINLMHSVLSIPALPVAFIISGMLFQIMGDKMGITSQTITDALEMLRENPDNILDILNTNAIVLNQLIIAGALYLVCTGVVAIGPFQSGITFVTRNFAREEHVFLWSDYWRVAKKNLKQSLIVMIINVAGIFFFAIWFRAWYFMAEAELANNIILRYSPTFMFMFLLMFFMMQIYIQQMLITFKFKIWQLYKNAFLLAMIKFLPNLGIILVNMALVFVSLAFNALVGAFLYIIILPATCMYINNYYANGIIKKYLILTKEEREKEEAEKREQKKKMKKRK